MSRFLCWAEFLLIVMLFFVVAGGAVPDVNEAHYLTKAKSYWQPDWCRDDLFLESADAHLVFYWLFGWITQFVPLPTAAWVGRIIGWAMLAGSWMWLSRATEFGRRHGMALLTAAIATALWQNAHMAGEWVLGGFEAKVPAYACVFLSLACVLRGSHGWAIVIVGAATALHPLVGGWSALALAYAICRAPTAIDWAKMLPAILAGLLIAAAGVVPALALDRAPADVARQANLIYVYQRLPHHLVAHTMSSTRIIRFIVMTVAWLAIRRRITLSRGNVVVQRFADFSLFIAAGGLALDALGLVAPALAAKFLKFYWFRLADIAVPVAVAFLIAEWGAALHEERSPKFAPGFIVTLTLLVLAVAMRFLDYRRDPRPGADRQGQMLSADQQSQAMRRYHDWRSMCDWVREFTSEDALFLTPTYSQTFKWYAGRAEVATWKDIPQDAAAVVEWSELRELIAATGVYNSEMEFDPLAMQTLYADRDVDYIVTVREFGRIDWDLPLIYQNETFQVFRCGPKPRA